MPSIEITSKGSRRVVPIEKPALTIGRQSDNDIVLDDTMASRKHCTLERAGATFRLRDLNSRNGTWVDGKRVSEIELHAGRGFRIGSTEFRLVVEAPADKSGEVVVEPPPDDDDGVITVPAPSAAEEPGREMTQTGLGRGPLAGLLAPLTQAARMRQMPNATPASPADIRLLDRQSKPLHLKPGAAHGSAGVLTAWTQILFVAIRLRVTDIHLEPKNESFGVRVRIDGQMHPVGEIPRALGSAMLNVVKVLCQVDIAKKSVVQEGNFAVALPDRRVDFRVSLTPSTFGQKLALRILDKATVPMMFEDLGMEPDVVAEVRRVCNQDAGMIIVSGPTGSGKSTTLYTALKCIDSRTRNVVTIEDPVEYQMEGTTQISIDPLHNVTFASVLGTVLRQDPDVILVGEVRDSETAELAMQAATTGHLVLTTVHARDTIGTIFRLLDLGVEPYLLANAMTLAISQRLVRVLCPYCRRPYTPDARRSRDLRLDDRRGAHLFTHVGCNRCMKTGYSGRMAIFEMLSFTPALRDVILTRPTVGEIRKAAGDWMFRSLTDSGFRKVCEGLTTVEEVERVSTAD